MSSSAKQVPDEVTPPATQLHLHLAFPSSVFGSPAISTSPPLSHFNPFTTPSVATNGNNLHIQQDHHDLWDDIVDVSFSSDDSSPAPPPKRRTRSIFDLGGSSSESEQEAELAPAPLTVRPHHSARPIRVKDLLGGFERNHYSIVDAARHCVDQSKHPDTRKKEQERIRQDLTRKHLDTEVPFRGCLFHRNYIYT
jgi:hypothetical protein